MGISETAQQLRLEAFDGKYVDPDNVRELIHELDSSNEGEWIDILWIIGRSQMTEFEPFVSRSIHCERPAICESALNTVFLQWPHEKRSQYIGMLERYAKGVEWDDFDQVRVLSLSLVGVYLRGLENVDSELLNLLVMTARDESERESVRDAAYTGLAKVLAPKQERTASFVESTPFESDGWNLYERASELIRSE